LFPPDDERLSLETCRGRNINTLKKVKKVRQVGCKSRNVLGFFDTCLVVLLCQERSDSAQSVQKK
jgi:hypothetical protein